MDKIIEKAFDSLAITCNRQALHPTDEDRIKITLKTLYKNGVHLPASEIEAYLSSNNWAPKPIKSISNWISSISSGGRVQLKNKLFLPTEEEIWEELNA